MTFDSVDSIRLHNFVGNHASDAEAFDAIHQFASDLERPIGERAEALRIMQDVGMGCGRSERVSDADLLIAYFE